MTRISKRDAAQLVARIRQAHVSGYAIAARVGGNDHAAMAGFVGGLESVLRHFLEQHGCREAAAALKAAMNDVPSAAEIAARNAEISSYARKSGSPS